MSSIPSDQVAKNIGEWGPIFKDQFTTQFGEEMYRALRRRGFLDERETEHGHILWLSRSGRLYLGFSNVYKPTESAMLDAAARRIAVQTLLEEGFKDPEAKRYGKFHIGMTDPKGRPVCVMARFDTFRKRTLVLLLDKTFAEIPKAELDRIIAFVPKRVYSKLKHLPDQYANLEVRTLDAPSGKRKREAAAIN